jgi:hypothetical protein
VGNLLYLVVPAAVAAAIIAVIVLRNRKPTSMEAGIEAFSRELKALAPERGGGAGGANTGANANGSTGANGSAGTNSEPERDRGHPG